MNIKKIIFFIFTLIYIVFPFDNTSIIQITLSDSEKGFLNGYYDATISVVDHDTSHVIWSEDRNIYFDHGFAELKLGPIDNLVDIVSPYVVLTMGSNKINFPIYPSLFSVYSKFATQLSDMDALYIKDRNVGLGTQSPDEKLSIQGNIQFLSSDNGIKFKNGDYFSSDRLRSITSSFNLIHDDINHIDLNIQSITHNMEEMIASINRLQQSNTDIQLNIDSDLTNVLLKLDEEGQISPVTEFYISDTNHYLLSSHAQGMMPTRIGHDFTINQNELLLAPLSSLTLKDSLLEPSTHSNGQIRYYNGDYYVFKSDDWHQIQTLGHTNVETIVLTPSALSELNPGLTNGGIAFDGQDYYFWNGDWLKYDQTKINTDNLSNNTIPIWVNHQFESLSIGDGLMVNEGNIQLDSTILIDQGKVGIGVDPTESLDVNGGLRLRTQSLHSLSNVSEGTIVYDGTHFKGFDGEDWQTLSIPSVVIDDTSDQWVYDNVHLIANPNGYVGIKVNNPQSTLDVGGNLRVRTVPNNDLLSSFLVVDSDGDIYSRSLSLDDFLDLSESSTLVIDKTTLEISTQNAVNGDFLIFKNNAWGPGSFDTDPIFSFSNSMLSLSTDGLSDGDILAFKNGAWGFNSVVKPDGIINFNDNAHLILSTENSTVHDVLFFKDDQWQSHSLIKQHSLITLDDQNHLVISTLNATSNDILIFNDNEWKKRPLFDESSLMFGEKGLGIASQNADVGDQLTWDGSAWIPSKNIRVSYVHVDSEDVLYTGSNGIDIIGSDIRLASNLSWENNTFTIGSINNFTEFRVNRLSSNLTSPLKLLNSNNETLLKINDRGQLSIGYSESNGYSIASKGFNYFDSVISEFQTAIGTTNIGTVEHGPTLLIQSTYYENQAADMRSIMEVLDNQANSRFQILENGHIGISTGDPKATLDINGFARLKPYDEEPTTCDLDQKGSIALNSHYQICACTGSDWVETNDGSTPCQW